MARIEIVVPAGGGQRWHQLLGERLEKGGHAIRFRLAPGAGGRDWPMEGVLRLERQVFRRGRDSLAGPVPMAAGRGFTGAAELLVDLGCGLPSAVPVLSLRFSGVPTVAGALRVLARGGLPELAVVLDGQHVVATARPMLDNPALLAASLEDVLARAVTLLAATVGRWSRGLLPAATVMAETAVAARPGGSAIFQYGRLQAPSLLREVWRRSRFRHAHWRVGYRFTDGEGVAQTGRLGTGWSVLPDDSTRFFADPFPISFEGRFFLFVEDYPHATGKAVISLVEFDAALRPSAPRPVLEEPYHLSYPQVFAREGAIWMLPESSAGKTLVLYRADPFPDRWVPYATLMEGVELSDATLLEREGRLWLFATERDGFGSTSDTMVVFSAERMEGPWQPHPANPVMVDRTAARPGGSFVVAGERLLLPVQDGTLGYGGGLGLSELVVLGETRVGLTAPVPIDPAGDWPYPKIHTLNRAGRLEVIDGIAAVRRRPARPTISPQGATGSARSRS